VVVVSTLRRRRKSSRGRFNRQGTPALYLAIELNTAIVEFNQGFPFRLVPPVTIVSYAVDCDDLTDRRMRASSNVFASRDPTRRVAWKLLAGTSQPVPSWALADRLRAGRRGGHRRSELQPWSIRRCEEPGALAVEAMLCHIR